MFIDRKLDCRILACAKTYPENGVQVDAAREIIATKRPETLGHEFLEHLKRLRELEYVEYPDFEQCDVSSETDEHGTMRYTITSKGEEYLQAMLNSDLFDF
ncbi:hypothetical protein [Halodesulfovibrio spirochaetisodalis]|uniref:Uncharacterized protein n=1 Tax=Halodesulfovibrio spirochaetisodalis TaxID=1560234 RepID=A0A1B7XDI3_9BACT|nr:hypothetical protein [Halodesulfovibrio spirochaetisodalis]OBQ52106.1 hypothetical protein SP90_07945 [Halodesulfovibrio spirochaetisodalis]